MTRQELEAELAEASALYEENRPRLDVPAGPDRAAARDRIIAAQEALRLLDVAGD